MGEGFTSTELPVVLTPDEIHRLIVKLAVSIAWKNPTLYPSPPKTLEYDPWFSLGPNLHTFILNILNSVFSFVPYSFTTHLLKPGADLHIKQEPLEHRDAQSTRFIRIYLTGELAAFEVGLAVYPDHQPSFHKHAHPFILNTSKTGILTRLLAFKMDIARANRSIFWQR